MNSSQLSHYLQSDDCVRPIFAGVYAIDELPMHVEKRPSLFVINTDFARNIGKHWLSAYFANDRERSCTFFDSLGQHPTCYHQFLMTFLNGNCTYFRYNTQCLQSSSSSVCGHYVMYFGYCQARNVPLENMLSRTHFGLNTEVNDLYVYNFCKRFYGIY